MSDLLVRYSTSVMNTFGPPKLALVRGRGAHVWDDDGNEYVDFLGGIAVNTLGHDHPALVEAVTTQLRTLGHVSNFFTTEPQVALAEKLLEICAPSRLAALAPQGPEYRVPEERSEGRAERLDGPAGQERSGGRVPEERSEERAERLDGPAGQERSGGRVPEERSEGRAERLDGPAGQERSGGRVPEERSEERAERLEGPVGKVFFANSGAEANEAALKLTRLTGRTQVVAMEDCFHGRTMGSLALTSKKAYRAPFEPLPGHVTWVPFADVDALEAAVTDETAAVVIEPLQGEAGVNVAPAGFLRAARQITERHGALLWLDEVQSGMARTGSWLASQPSGVVPDIVTLAKGLGGGLPIGACLGFGRAATLFEPGNHGTTFGGNPISCAAALAVIETIESEGLLARAIDVGERLRHALVQDDRVTEARGVGVLVGLTLAEEKGPQVVQAAQHAGFIVNATGPDRVRLAPPLVVTDADVQALITAWPAVLDAAWSAS